MDDRTWWQEEELKKAEQSRNLGAGDHIRAEVREMHKFIQRLKREEADILRRDRRSLQRYAKLARCTSAEEPCSSTSYSEDLTDMPQMLIATHGNASLSSGGTGTSMDGVDSGEAMQIINHQDNRRSADTQDIRRVDACLSGAVNTAFAASASLQQMVVSGSNMSLPEAHNM
ncbi:hypothetical protein CBR_g19520 [Chara braunii]|uniref:Uncharacterized protein n=1 Tax=Chara braunii TaxID=69332 RepID=A0A388KY67_CHABU|nr:hypothetical protein CBR_g19520 [Chara braunii]|eukprot:GBG75006.1 hypothetical protein CBR_g19520 [Chara braunii]